METILEQDHCPNCGYELNAATHLTDDKAQPSPGDLSVCFMCSTPLVYDQNLKLSILTEEDMKKLPPEIYEELIEVIFAINQTRKEL